MDRTKAKAQAILTTYEQGAALQMDAVHQCAVEVDGLGISVHKASQPIADAIDSIVRHPIILQGCDNVGDDIIQAWAEAPACHNCCCDLQPQALV